jgi:hypothetical protein
MFGWSQTGTAPRPSIGALCKSWPTGSPRRVGAREPAARLRDAVRTLSVQERFADPLEPANRALWRRQAVGIERRRRALRAPVTDDGNAACGVAGLCMQCGCGAALGRLDTRTKKVTPSARPAARPAASPPASGTRGLPARRATFARGGFTGATGPACATAATGSALPPPSTWAAAGGGASKADAVGLALAEAACPAPAASDHCSRGSVTCARQHGARLSGPSADSAPDLRDRQFALVRKLENVPALRLVELQDECRQQQHPVGAWQVFELDHGPNPTFVPAGWFPKKEPRRSGV